MIVRAAIHNGLLVRPLASGAGQIEPDYRERSLYEPAETSLSFPDARRGIARLLALLVRFTQRAIQAFDSLNLLRTLPSLVSVLDVFNNLTKGSSLEELVLMVVQRQFLSFWLRVPAPYSEDFL